MKKQVIFFVVAFLTLTWGVDAQNQARQGNRQQFDPKQRAEQMATALELTEDQKTKVQALLTDQQTKMSEVRQQLQSDQVARRQKMTELREKFNVELEKIIGKEKTDKWRTIQQEQMRQRQADRQQRQP